MSKLNKLFERGDTIVEVLICMAIVGFALSICYGIAHRSLYTVRQSEEHGQSLQLAEGQLERFRAYLAINSSVSTDPAAPPANFILDAGHYGFCILNEKTAVPGSGILKVQKVQNDPKDPLCAVNTYGVYYCEAYDCTTAPTKDTVDNRGYFYRSGIAYCHTSCTGSVKDQFYGLAGRYAVDGQTSNTEAFDVVTIEYRIHQ